MDGIQGFFMQKICFFVIVIAVVCIYRLVVLLFVRFATAAFDVSTSSQVELITSLAVESTRPNFALPCSHKSSEDQCHPLLLQLSIHCMIAKNKNSSSSTLPQDLPKLREWG